jgi:molecular chaperone DnaK (HSP70)
MYSVGIDLGTTNTVVAANAGILPLRMGDDRASVLPSVVAYLPNGEKLVGAAARSRRAIDPRNTIHSAKRVIGAHWHSYESREFGKHYGFKLEPTPDQRVGFRTRSGLITPIEVAREVLSSLCIYAAIDPSEIAAVVSVPAAFGDTQRAATLAAVREAGFADARCIAEPVATAVAYLDRQDIRYGLVYDLGGGTFDAAIVDCSQEPMRIVAHSGDAYLGGDDIDQAIANYAADLVLRSQGWDLRGDPEVFARLLFEGERAKLRLAQSESTQLELSEVDPAAPGVLGALPLDRNVVWQLASGLIRRTFLCCDEVLSKANLKVSDVQAVFMAGGATQLPGVRETVAQYFGRILRYELDPMHVVSLGASIAAARPKLASLLVQPVLSVGDGS